MAKNRNSKSYHPLYNTWMNIKYRCYNSASPRFKDYGGRGIKMSEEWFNSFEHFCNDVGNRPSRKYSLDRIDNNGNYCKENCRWATRLIQNNNSRKNRLVCYNGVVKTMSQWARFFEIKPSTFRQRFYGYKWPFERCIIKTN